MGLRSFRDWMAEDPGRRAAPWLVLGKGPSFARLAELERDAATQGMLRFGLNHVVRETRLDVFHTIDVEVVEHCEEALGAHRGVVVLPWAPHERRRLVPFSGYREFLPSGLSLADYLDRYPILQQLAEEDRLLWYNLRTAPRRLRRPEAPITPARGFSASAAVALLAACGVRRIRTLGVDGGNRYAGAFGDLTDQTLLAAGQVSFDSQFGAMAGLIHQYGMDLGALDHPAPVRVLIGVGPGEQLPARVLAASLRRWSSLTLDVVLVAPAPDRDRGLRAAVGPGRCIYVDACCLVEGDLRALWVSASGCEEPVSLSAVAEAGCPPVLILDSEQAPLIGPQETSNAGFSELATIPQPVPVRNGEGAWVTHWPRGGPQPWHHPDAPGARRWCGALIDAIADGAISPSEVERAIVAGDARRSLPVQLERGWRDPALLPRHLWRRECFAGRAAEPGWNAAGSGLFRVARAHVSRWAEAGHWPRWWRYAGLVLDKGWKVLRGVGRWRGGSRG